MALERAARGVVAALVVIVLATGYGVYWWYQGSWQRPASIAAQAGRKLADGVSPSDVWQDLAKHDEKTRLDVLQLLARSSSSRVRSFAAKRLAQFSTRREVAALLRELATHDPDPGVRKAAAASLDVKDE